MKKIEFKKLMNDDEILKTKEKLEKETGGVVITTSRNEYDGTTDFYLA